MTAFDHDGTRHLEVRDGHRVVADLDVEVRRTDIDWVVRADLQPGPRLPAEAVPAAVDTVAAIPEVAAQGGHLHAAVRAGDVAALHRVHEHAEEVQAQLAGTTSIVDADLPPRP